MNIAIIGSKDFDSLEFHLNESLSFLGHSTVIYDIKDVVPLPYKYNFYLQKFSTKYTSFLFKKLASMVIDRCPNLVICTYRFIPPEFVLAIKKAMANVKIVQFNPDALTTFQEQQIFVSPYDAYFTKDPFIVDFMRSKMNLAAFYLPESFNQRVHNYRLEDRTSLESKIDIDVVCFGTMYPYRAQMVKFLLKKGIDVKLFGTPDSRFPLPEIEAHFQNEFIAGERKAEVLLGSKIVFNNFHYAEVESVNAKFFEIAGIGGFQICDYKRIVDEYSVIPSRKFTFKHIEEAAELIQHYLKLPEERHRLASEQKSHFLQHHTYDVRMKQMLTILELE